MPAPGPDPHAAARKLSKQLSAAMGMIESLDEDLQAERRAREALAERIQTSIIDPMRKRIVELERERDEARKIAVQWRDAFRDETQRTRGGPGDCYASLPWEQD